MAEKLPVKDGKVLAVNGGGRPVLLTVEEAKALLAREENRDPKGHPVSTLVAADHPAWGELVALARGESEDSILTRAQIRAKVAELLKAPAPAEAVSQE